MKKKPSHSYQIKLSLDNTHPPVWRRILVPGNTTLLKLHDTIQIAMGWESYHLYMFRIDGLVYGDPADDEFGDLGTEDAANYRLDQVIYGEGQRFSYEYDFGDGWMHTLLVEKILPVEEAARYPVCVKGKNACPPEDVGGVGGYANFLEAIHDPFHVAHDECLTWIGGEFDPEAFDLEEVNNRLRHMGRGISADSSQDRHSEAEATKEFAPTSSWLQALPEEQRMVAENLPLRRDMITLLTYLQENKVTGTQSTGNFPLKAVYELCSRLVDPLKVDGTTEDYPFRIRSEIEVRPLYFRHVLAVFGGFITGGPARRWNLTTAGKSYLSLPSPVQVWLLFLTWWKQINWEITFPYEIEGGIPPGFDRLALERLLEIPGHDPVLFEPFADRIIKEAGLVWPIQDQNSANRILHSLIEMTIVDPLVDFEILQVEYEPHKVLGERYRELSAFRVTPFGKGLLESLKVTYDPSKTRN